MSRYRMGSRGRQYGYGVGHHLGPYQISTSFGPLLDLFWTPFGTLISGVLWDGVMYILCIYP